MTDNNSQEEYIEGKTGIVAMQFGSVLICEA